MIDDFAIMITTHGRPHKVKTYNTLRRAGYTGPIYLVCDNEDQTLDEYKREYGDQIIVFDKGDAATRTDLGDNSPGRKTAVFARNECYRIARHIGVRYFMQVDDDYHLFTYVFDSGLRYLDRPIFSLDAVLAATLKYMRTTEAYCIAYAQGGDFVGGTESDYAKAVKVGRKAMNTFILDTERPLSFFGRINDDVNAYVAAGMRGQLVITLFQVKIGQEQTGVAAGGMTEVYRQEGTYKKSFYSVMCAPSSVKIATLGKTGWKRIHHNVMWENTAVKIIAEKWRKGGQSEH